MRDLFISNYLKDARRRHSDQETKRLQKAEEMRSRVTAPPPYTPVSLVQGRSCRTPGCQYCALPDLSLCDRCASQQQWGTLDRTTSLSRSNIQPPSGYNTFPGRHKAPTGLPQSSDANPENNNDEIYKYGKSKFYTPHPNNAAKTTGFSNNNNALVESLPRSGNISRPPPAPRPRSPSPDYDNLRSEPGQGTNPKCITPGCEFFGSKDKGNMCSSCFRNKPSQAQLAQPEKTTRL